MKSNIKKISFFNRENVSIKSISTISIFSFYFILNFYTFRVFYQFSNYSIFFLSLIFLSLFIFLTILFDKKYFKEKIQFNLYNTLFSLIVSFILIMIASSALVGIDYYRTFPLLEADLGLDCHPDSSFHISIIQSIISFGYPSIGQHGHPILFYHTLSHYFDALILSISKMDPFDSYGIFYYFKVFILLSSILVYVSQTIKDKSPFIFIFSFLIIAPIITSTWSPVFSHALWLTSVILILSANKIFILLRKKEKNSLQDFIYVFTLIIVLSIGKISVGFMYATFVGMYLLLKEPKNYRVYLLGLGWILFFILYNQLISGDSKRVITAGYEHISLLSYFTDKTLNKYQMMQSIYTSIFIFFILFLFSKGKENFRFFISSLFSLFTLVLLVAIIKDQLTPAHAYYFKFSLAFVLILFMFQNIFRNIKSTYMQLIALVVLILLSNFYYLSNFNILNINTKSIEQRFEGINYSPFNYINKKFPAGEEINLLNGGVKTVWLNKQKRPIQNFKEKLNNFLISKKIDKKNLLLYIPKEIYENDLNSIKRAEWSKGLFIYALTGIPLIYGTKELQHHYGYNDYDKNSLWIDRVNFDSKKVCNMQLASQIIIVEKFDEPKFTIINCSES